MNSSVILDSLIANNSGNTLNFYFEDIEFELLLEAILRGFQIRGRGWNFSIGRGISGGQGVEGSGICWGRSPGNYPHYEFKNECQSTFYEEMIESESLSEERVVDSFFIMYLE